MTDPRKALADIKYLTIPPDLAQPIGDFKLDPTIALPVELAPGHDRPGEGELSWEMIVAGMLKIVAYDRRHEHFDYYRDFVQAVKPTIFQELSTTGILKAESQEWELAEEIFLALEGLDEGNPRTMVNMAVLYENKAQFMAEREKLDEASQLKSLAKKKYSAALAVNPPLPDAFFNAGLFYLKNGDFERAKPLLTTFLEISRDAEKSEAAQKALDQFEKQFRLDNLFKEAYDFIVMGQEAKGIEKIRAFLVEYPQVWNGWFLLGWAHRRLGEFEKARDAFQEALKTGGDQVDSLNELSICQMELGDFKESRKNLIKALRMEPENVKIISNLGVLALKTGTPDEARGFFETVLEYVPEDPVALRYLADLG